MLAAARKLWLAPLLVLQHSSLLRTATCNSFAALRNRVEPPTLQKIILDQLAYCKDTRKSGAASSSPL